MLTARIGQSAWLCRCESDPIQLKLRFHLILLLRNSSYMWRQQLRDQLRGQSPPFDICGASGVRLVFPAARGDHISDSLFTALTAQDPLVDLCNDFPVLAASSSVNS